MRLGWMAAWWVSGALALVLALGTFGHALAYRDRIQPGVRALDLDLGGLSEGEARERLTAHLESLARRSGGRPALRVDGVEIALPRNAYGEPAALASQVSAAAVRIGRETPLGPLGSLFRAAHAAGFTGVGAGFSSAPTGVPAPEADGAALRSALVQLAEELDRPTVEAQILIQRSAPLQLVPVTGRNGRRLDVERTAAGLAAAFNAGSAGPVDGTFVPLAPSASEAQLQAAQSRIAAALSLPLTVTVAGVPGRSWPLTQPAQLVERVEVTAAGGTLMPALAPAAFDVWASPVLQAGVRTPQDARLEVRGDDVIVVPDVPGAAVDAAILRTVVASALMSVDRRIEVAPQPVAARITAATLAGAQVAAQRATSVPITLKRGDRTWTLERAELARLLTLPVEPDGAPRLDATRLRTRLEALGKESDKPAKNPRLEVREGQIATVPGEDGEGLDVPATIEAVQAALHAGGAERSVALATRPTPPDVSDAKLDAARTQAQRIVSAPLTARHAGKTWGIAQAELPGMLLFGESVNGIVPYLSRDTLVERLRPIAAELDPQFDRDYQTAVTAWERREEARAAREAEVVAQGVQAAQAAQAGDEAGASATTATTAAAVAAIRDAAKKDPKPRRQWVDVPATAGALWVQAAGAVADGRVTRVADVKLTTDDPAKVATAARAGSSAAAAPAKWIDINLTTQSVVAYEGDWPVFSSLVSTGLPRTPTPPGTYKVFTKLVADDMRGGSVATGDAYFLPQVPYVMYFLEGGYAIHGTYWHSNFGNPMSRGCVNLTPQNAKWLFDWAALGTTVVVHS